MLVQEEEAVAVVCLQAQRVTGLPAAVQQIQLGCHHLGPGREAAPVRARACASRGVADFHNQVLLLHCGTAVTSHSVLLTVSVSVSSSSSYQLQHLGGVDLGQRQPGTEILSFVLSGAAAGAVLTLALHNRLVPPRTTNYNSCLPLPACCRRSKRQHQQQQGYDSDESAGFITIEKQPPSDNLVTTDDQDQDVDSSSSSSRVEDEFLAMLETETDLDLDMLVKDAEAELILARAHLLKDENAAASLM